MSRHQRPGAGAAAPAELPVFTRDYDLFLWSFERAEGFPKVLRPTLTQRWQALLLEGLELLLELRYTREREALFRRTNLAFEKLRVLARALEARRALSPTQYEHFQRRLDEVGRQLGGWRRAQAARPAAEERSRSATFADASAAPAVGADA
ncbi:MAG: four helix bundle protein [Planctomycetes bacterium]|nr:four helix bundle protein [Planctomycetota bacterium]